MLSPMIAATDASTITSTMFRRPALAASPAKMTAVSPGSGTPSASIATITINSG